jgi:hypothetical protein
MNLRSAYGRTWTADRMDVPEWDLVSGKRLAPLSPGLGWRGVWGRG